MKPLPLLVALVLGAVIGYLVGRPSVEEPNAATQESRPDSRLANTPLQESADPAKPAASRDTHAKPVPSSQAVPASAPAPATPSDITSPIDAGPVFNQQFAAAEKQGISDGMVEAHRALEREVRDDSWSYPLEAEIENSLVSDTSMGNFRKEHLECRSTMCEIRLSAQGGAQIEALRQWTSDIQKFPWAQQMQLSSSSTVSSDDRMDALLIVSKPPGPPESN